MNVLARTPSVHVIVLNWNSCLDTLKCLAGLLCSDYPDLQIVVIDNASTDGSETRIRQTYPDARFIQTGSNLGYAGGNNVGIVCALRGGADYIFIVNPDVELEPETLTELVRTAVLMPRLGALSPAVVYKADPQQVWFGGGRIDWQKGMAHHEHMCQPVSSLPHSDFAPTDYASGCCLLLSAEALRQVGTFDEAYFLYWEEVDLCQRMLRAGYTVGVCHNVRVRHEPSKAVGDASARQQYYLARGAFRFFSQHGSVRARLRASFGAYRRTVLNRSTFKAVAHGDKQAMARLHALTDFALGRFGRRKTASH